VHQPSRGIDFQWCMPILYLVPKPCRAASGLGGRPHTNIGTKYYCASKCCKSPGFYGVIMQHHSLTNVRFTLPLLPPPLMFLSFLQLSPSFVCARLYPCISSHCRLRLCNILTCTCEDVLASVGPGGRHDLMKFHFLACLIHEIVTNHYYHFTLTFTAIS
jgi:hypothetical protein